MNSKLFRKTPAILLFSPLIVLIALAVSLAQTLSASGSIVPTPTVTPFPPGYPSVKKTLEVGARLTDEAFLLTPPSLSEEGLFPPAGVGQPAAVEMSAVGTPAGAGIITYDFLVPSRGYRITGAWYERLSNGKSVMVYAGALNNDETQGVVIVDQGSAVFSEIKFYMTSTKAGALTIVGAQGERLILSSSTGATFYFDVPSLRFVLSLTEVAPTVTSAPTWTPEPTSTLRYTDDAPDDPWDISQTSPAYTDLAYRINSSADQDWFRFHTEIAGTIQINLTGLPANYDLHVYSATDTQLRVSSTNTGTASEQVTLTNAPVNDYYVQVVGVSGAFNATTPYTLRFNAPVNVNLNFQPSTAPVPAGYLVDSGAVYGDRGNGYTYGWNLDNSANTRDRNSASSPDQRYDTLIHTQSGGTFTWEIALPNGTYSVRIVAGDPNYYNSVYKINAEGVLVVNGTPTTSTRWIEGTALVTVADGKLTVSSATGSSNNKIDFIEIQQSASAPTNTPTATATRYPTNYPPVKQTLEVALQQTLQAGALTPRPTDYIFSFPPATNAPFPFPTPVGTIAGVGLITTELGSPVSSTSFSASNAWMETTSSGRIVAYAGAYTSDSAQGVIIVSERAGTIRNWFPTSIKAGKLTITGAQGERLILSSDNGTTFYFDVPGRMFVSSLTVVVSTVTPVPIFTSAPTITPRFTDDAPDDPWYGFQNSLVNTDLNYKINSGADVDWFRFPTDYAGTVQVSLTNLPANYDLYVYSATDNQLRVSSTNTGTASEQVTLTNAPANDYYVRVVGVSGAFNATTPYTLRFNAPVNVNINFQPASAPIPAGYLVDSGAVYGNRGNGYTYGWIYSQ